MRALLAYFATRLAGLAPIIWPEAVLLSEPTKWLVEIDELGPAKAFPEYPWPAVALLHLPMRLGVPTIVHYYSVVILAMLALDALFVWLLWRAGGRGLSRGLWVWLIVFPALGPLAVTRFDLLPAVLAGGALLALAAAKPAAAGALAALGTGFKVWPAVGVPALFLPGGRRERLRVATGLCAAAAVLALATVAAAGWARLWSPLAAQLERGVHVEAFAALPVLWARYLHADSLWLVQYAAARRYEISGPGVDLALRTAGLAMFVALVWLVVVHVRAFASPAAARDATRAAVLTALSLVAWLATAPVFSPQHMIWLAAPLAVLGTLPGMALARIDVALFAAAAVLTHLIYPLTYEAILIERHPVQLVFLLFVTARDALIIALGARLAKML